MERWAHVNILRYRTLLWPIVLLAAIVLIIRQATNARDLADLLRAIATLAWPGVAALGMSWFKTEIRSLLSRIRKGKFLGNEVELDTLESKAVEAEEKVDVEVEKKKEAVSDIELRSDEKIQADAAVVQADQTLQAASVIRLASVDDAIDEVLTEVSRSPSLGLMLLSSKLERAARDLAAKAGITDGRQRSLSMLVQSLVRSEILLQEVGDALEIFSRIRNRVVHGHDANEDEVVRAIDSGSKLLRTIMAASSMITIVRHVDIPLFSDANATVPLANVAGTIIDIGDGTGRAIFPTRRRLQVGMRVIEAWDLGTTWADTWYRDPENGDIKKAWREAAEFIGRPIGSGPTMSLLP